METKSGFYIWMDATLVAGPFDTYEDAMASLSPEGRKGWTWGFKGGVEAFLKIPTDAFSVLRTLPRRQYRNG